MQNHNKFFVIGIIATIPFLSSCAIMNTPNNWEVSASDKTKDVYGGWITITNNTNEIVDGELLAIDDDSVYVVKNEFKSIKLSSITEAKLVLYDSDAVILGGLTFLGSLSTISNGGFLIFTFPLWVIGGTASTVTRSFEPILNYPQNNWKEFRSFSRYPEGLPKNIIKAKLNTVFYINDKMTSKETKKK